MSHSCWVCNGGTALLDFDLGYHMGIQDKGGGEFLTSYFIGGLKKELRQDLYLLRFVSVQEASVPTLKLLKAMWLGRPIDHTHQFDFMIANDGMVLSHGCSHVHFRVQDYDCVHTVFPIPLGNCILDFDLGYLLGIRDQGGGFEVDNGHTGKEENFCKAYGQELESLRALLLSPRAHSKGLGAMC
ncbi:unnamed protein product [Prunus armeniaca]|uniref:Uncharacterized protein n=1 Tax=Prunus armeniaca TaxID=36596 RepID=A0A6J5VK70_PRUAR|nr:unnamed protein product [Prunus armeniaca]